jgi:anaerobic C4-dicarboxylate transporter
MAKISGLIILAILLGFICACKPAWLSDNEFLNDFVGSDYLSLLSVMMTVTLAAVATVRVSIARMASEQFAGKPKIQEALKEVKDEITQNAWVIVFSFIAALLLVIFEGSFDHENDLSRAIAFAIALWILTLHLLATFDVYRVMFAISDVENVK